MGKEHPEVHAFKDSPHKLFGSRHRFLFHDPFTSLLILTLRGPRAALSSILHDLDDFTYGSKSRKKKDEEIDE